MLVANTRIKTTLLTLLLLTTFSQGSWSKVLLQEKTEKTPIQVEQIVEGLGVPWGMAFLNSDEILFTERSGGMGITSLQKRQVTRIRNVPSVMSGGQGGLLDVAVPPDYKAGDWVYFTYVKKKNGQGATTLARAKIKNTTLIDWHDVLVTLSGSDRKKHYGSRIAFDGKGHLFFTVGDRGDRPSAQDLSNHNGSVIRLTLDGSVPEDNPFLKYKLNLPEIWSYGHRNPQGIVFDATNDRLWAIEHGPRGGDEINLILPGRNYGWPVISYGKEYWGPKKVGEGTHKKDMEQPKKVYTPSIAPGSLLLYTGSAFPDWYGNLFAGALSLTHINRIGVNAQGELVTEERLLDNFGKRVRALAQGPDGFIYFSTDDGKILRLKPLSKTRNPDPPSDK